MGIMDEPVEKAHGYFTQALGVWAKPITSVAKDWRWRANGTATPPANR